MKKTDDRHYNIQEKRDLALSMDLYIALKGRIGTPKRKMVSNGVECGGIIEDVYVERCIRQFRRAVITFSNGSVARFAIKNSKIQGITVV